MESRTLPDVCEILYAYEELCQRALSICRVMNRRVFGYRACEDVTNLTVDEKTGTATLWWVDLDDDYDSHSAEVCSVEFPAEPLTMDDAAFAVWVAAEQKAREEEERRQAQVAADRKAKAAAKAADDEKRYYLLLKAKYEGGG